MNYVSPLLGTAKHHGKAGAALQGDSYDDKTNTSLWMCWQYNLLKMKQHKPKTVKFPKTYMESKFTKLYNLT